jgi:hypothetical protein
MAKKKASRKRAAPRSPSLQAQREFPPELWELIQELIAKWLARCKCNYYLIEIVDSRANPETQRVHEGDWVCWVNRDSTTRDVTFDSGFWPFTARPGTISVPACSPSAWYKVRIGSKTKSYGYKPAGYTGPPGGPDIIVE